MFATLCLDLSSMEAFPVVKVPHSPSVLGLENPGSRLVMPPSKSSGSGIVALLFGECERALRGHPITLVSRSDPAAPAQGSKLPSFVIKIGLAKWIAVEGGSTLARLSAENGP